MRQLNHNVVLLRAAEYKNCIIEGALRFHFDTHSPLAIRVKNPSKSSPSTILTQAALADRCFNSRMKHLRQRRRKRSGRLYFSLFLSPGSSKGIRPGTDPCTCGEDRLGISHSGSGCDPSVRAARVDTRIPASTQKPPRYAKDKNVFARQVLQLWHSSQTTDPHIIAQETVVIETAARGDAVSPSGQAKTGACTLHDESCMLRRLSHKKKKGGENAE
jgi:hypothetical protein